MSQCDLCDAWFDPDGDEDCQVGHDSGKSGFADHAVPSVCPNCFEKAGL